MHWLVILIIGIAIGVAIGVIGFYIAIIRSVYKYSPLG